jgi:hypothetical protein
MEVLYERCCGLDVHKASITACVLIQEACVEGRGDSASLEGPITTPGGVRFRRRSRPEPDNLPGAAAHRRR